MSPILCLIASCLLQTSQPAGEPASEPPPADPVIGWARVEFNTEGIVSAEAGGYADLETMRELTVDDPVRIASVSKLVVALGVMRLVEAGVLDLDADVSEYLGWELRNPAFTDTPITLRHLLGHRSGLRDDAGYALPLNADLEEWLTQDGAWNGEHEPGQWFSYANLNFPVVAAVMEGATGERFDRIMQAQVFEPLELDACFNWTTCSEEARSRAVVLYRPDGEIARDSQRAIAEDCPAVPASDGTCNLESYVLAQNGAAFSPQGGLRISVRDLGRIGGMLLNEGDSFLANVQEFMPIIVASYRPRPDEIVPSTPVSGDTEDIFCVYGLGFHTIRAPFHGCRDQLFRDSILRHGHSGEAYSLRSGIWISHFSQPHSGVAYFATGLPETGAMPGRSAFTAIEERLAQGAPVETFVPYAVDGDE